jgi:hypothetical protein
MAQVQSGLTTAQVPGRHTMPQDPTELDPKHYKVEFENDRIRVLRVTYQPGEKSKMHKHPASVHVFLTDVHARISYPDGKTEEINDKAGHTMYHEPWYHSPENLGNQPIELVQIELKD